MGVRKAVILDSSTIEWIHSKISDGKFRNFSHGLDWCVAQQRRRQL